MAERVQRRTFLKGLAASAAVALGFGANHAQAKPAGARPEVGLILNPVEAFERDFPFKLATRTDAPAGAPTEWSDEQVRLVRSTLEALPKDAFYPDKPGPKPEIVLGLVPDAQVDPQRPRSIELDYRTLTPEDGSRAVVDIVEGLTALSVPYTQYFEGHGKIPHDMQSPWFDQVYGIIGGHFGAPLPAIQEIVARDKESAIDGGSQGAVVIIPGSSGGAEAGLVSKIGAAINDDRYPRLLIPMLAGEYVSGEEQFTQDMKPYFNEDTAALYQFMKDTVFGGQEFSANAPQVIASKSI